MMEPSYSSRVFLGVRFVLRGFNPVSETQIRFKLVNGGGVDAGAYGGNCTHVIVDRISYDDPVCVDARKDRKTLVTGLWVDHSADIGMPVDATSVMYRPLKDLDGIPGAKNLLMCLTGYLRQDREDIMTMVGLMGAQFSKPLVAHKVTHLICYKFEGEKYELAKRLGTIKLVNHRWLEDCLKEWELLPEDKYSKSGFELEIVDEEAKDSEEEAEDFKLGQSGRRDRNQSPLSLKFGTPATHGLPKSVKEASNALPDYTGPQALPNVNNGGDSSTILGDKNRSGQITHNVHDSKISHQALDVSRHSTSWQLPDKYLKTSESKNADFPKTLGCQDLRNMGNANSSGQQPDLYGINLESKKLVSDLTSTSATAVGVANSNEKPRSTSYSRKNQKGFTLPRILDESSAKEGNYRENSKVEKASEGIKSSNGEGNDFTKESEPKSLLPQKRINEASSAKLKSRKMTADSKISISPANGSPAKSLPFDEPCSRNASPETAQCDHVYKNSPQTAVQSISESKIYDKPDSTGSGIRQVDGNEAAQHNVTESLDLSSLGNKKSHDVESAVCTNFSLSNEESNVLIKKSPRRKSIAKKSLGSKLKVGVTARQKKSLSLNETILQGEGVAFSSGSKEIAKSDANIHQGSPQILDINKTIEQETVCKRAEDAGDRTEFLDDETEALDDKCDFELGMAIDDESVHLSRKPDIATEAKSDAICPAAACEEAMPHKKRTNQTVKEKPSSPVTKPQARKRPAGKAKATVSKYAEDAGERTEFLDDETKAEDDKCEYKVGVALHEESVHVSKKPDTSMEEKSEAICPATACEEAMPPKKPTNQTVKQKPSSLVTKPQARKRPAGKAKATVSKYAEDAGERTEFLDDETKAEDDKCEYKVGVALHEESVHVSKKPDTSTEEKSEVICPATICGEAMPPTMKGRNKTEKQKPSSLPTKPQARKRSAGKAKATVTKKLSKSKAAVSGEKNPNGTGHESEIETVEEMSRPAEKSDNSAVPRDKPENLAEEEKENRPIDGEQDVVNGRSNGNPTVKSSVRSSKIKSWKLGLNQSSSESNTRVKTEVACFILSGHRLQRKEFQQVIKRLKGRVCRDSHQWSYQATHFIAPDPLRRTEKFFAAAASGRWILETDFLTACSQAGKLLAEEPYEWHKNGLSEDGAIHLGAPRKWRLLRERTGHGAFYGMRIVVYGDCIAPPLDTLKRVIKAGDGTILATSPPYSRFLGTGIDYAVVSPGMPRVDMWVQEFLKHEIPCVVADYLVEYVCKPGFSLEKHVLYGTHAWAERSFDRLKGRAEAEEIVEELVAPEDSSDDGDDIICQVCGSRDRGDVMLICGDESGSVGCGVGTHIDCCDPPLTDIPEEDWFCPKCSSIPNCTKNPNKRKKKNVLTSSQSMCIPSLI